MIANARQKRSKSCRICEHFNTAVAAFIRNKSISDLTSMLKIDGDIISADYIPENDNVQAHVYLNFVTREYKAEEIPGYGVMYSGMALSGLRKIIKKLQSGEITEVPKTRNVVWF